MRAAIDVGTNTVRLLLGDVSQGRVVPDRYVRRITRLGGGQTPDSGLTGEAMSRTLAALADFADELHRTPPVSVRAVGTEALRSAPNGRDFIARVFSETGLSLEIIDGEQEARLSSLGVLSALSTQPEYCLIFDIGGGSTEFTLCAGAKPLLHRSYPLGVVRLSEEAKTDVSRKRRIEAGIDMFLSEIAAAGLTGETVNPGCLLVGTAGTVTTLAALHLGMTSYDWRRVNNLVLPLSDLQNMAATLSPLTPAEREALPGVEKGRGDLIVPGLEIVLALLDRLQRSRLVVSDFGLLEGVLLSETQDAAPFSSSSF